MNKYIIVVIACVLSMGIRAQNNADSLLELGIRNLDNHNYKIAAEYLKHSVQLDSLNPKTYNCLGISYMNKGIYDSAEVYMNKALAIDTDYYAAYCNLSQCYLEMGDYRRAEDNALIYLSNCPDSMDAYIMLANVYFDIGEDTMALKQFQIALEKLGPDEDFYYGRGRLWLMMDSLDLALQDADEAIKLNASSDNFYLRGYIYENMGDIDDAEKDYAQALEINKNNFRAWDMLGLLYLNKGEYKKSLKLSEKYMEYENNGASAYYIMGYSYYFLEAYDKASEIAAKGIAKDSTLSELYSLKGAICLEQDQYKEAVHLFDEAIRRNPYMIYNYRNKAKAQLLINTSQDVLTEKEGQLIFKDLKWRNLQNIKNRLKDKKDKYYLGTLKDRLYMDFYTMGLDEFFMLYISSSLHSKSSSFSFGNEMDPLYTLMNEGKLEECIIEGQKLLKDQYSSMKINYQIAQCYLYLGNTEKAYEYFLKYEGFLSGICTSGDGKSYETAYTVIAVNDEYTILYDQGKSLEMQSLNYKDGQPFDVMHTIDAKGEEEDIYFNVTIVFEKYNTMFK